MNTQVADPLLGTLVDRRYRVRGRVARGGMATVYTAVDERLERTVALKIIHPGQVRDNQFLDKFTDEAKTIARLTHPNVVAVYDQGVHNGLPYLVMEYVRGRTLRDVLAERRRLAPMEALALMEQVLAALAAAHRAGLVHRDVKPENVLIAEAPTGDGNDLVDAVAKVADFGLARAVEVSTDPENGDEGQLMATVAYVAPELVADGYSDPRSDVYSAGIVLFEMLTGRVPFDGERPVDVAWQHVDRDVPPPSRLVGGLSPILDEVVARATRRDPSLRPADAAGFLTVVQQAREAITGAPVATQRFQAIEQPTMIVNHIQERPSWARLPAPAAKPTRSRRDRQNAHPAGVPLLEQLKQWHRQMTRDPRGRMILTAGMVVLALLLVFGLYWITFGRYGTAPSLVNMSREQAESQASASGFKLDFEYVFREDVKKDVVLDQDPKAGDRVVKGGTITLTLSKGPERYQVPNVLGKSYDTAAADLAADPFKFQVKRGADKYDDQAPVGTVLGTNPAVGTELKPGDTVEIILSKGRAPISVPSVIGLPLDQAKQKIQELGLTVVVEYVDSAEPRDQVVEQDPAAGSGAEPKQQIKLRVSNNPNSVGMPEVRTKSCQDAVNQLRGMGLQVNVDGNVFEQQFGKVDRQSPQAGAGLQQGQTVNIRCKI